MDDILKKIIPIIVKDADPQKIILFGSRAGGLSSDDSDYDLLIVAKSTGNNRKIMKKLYIDLYGIGAPVDLVFLAEDKINIVKENRFMVYKDALEQGVTVYEK